MPTTFDFEIQLRTKKQYGFEPMKMLRNVALLKDRSVPTRFLDAFSPAHCLFFLPDLRCCHTHSLETART
jgi:hypothetical protein